MELSWGKPVIKIGKLGDGENPKLNLESWVLMELPQLNGIS